MTIELELGRIASALEQLDLNFGGTDKTDLPKEGSPPSQVKPDPEPTLKLDVMPPPTKVELMAAVEQFLPDKRDEAVAVMAELGAEKIGDIQPENYREAIQMLNAAFNS